MIKPPAVPAVLSPEAGSYWAQQARRLYWKTPWRKVMAWVEHGPRSRWFIGGTTNLCYNALDRHLAQKSEKTALIHCGYDGAERHYSYRALHREVQAMAWILRLSGVAPGDRVLICLPMIPEAVIAMLACARLGAIHVVVYSALAMQPLAQRIQDCRPEAIVGYAGKRGRQQLASLEQACALSGHRPRRILRVDDSHYAAQRRRWLDVPLTCQWLPADAPSHLLYTSGTTGQPKGVVRDCAGYAVALLASLENLFHLEDDEVFFTSADVGWVTGHSYGVYAPLLAGITSVMVESSTLNQPGPRWWQLVERYGITRILTIPGAMRLARRRQESGNDNLRTLRAIYLAGEPLDAATRQWVGERTGIRVEDHYWQTESGWPILAGQHGVLQPVMSRQLTVLDSETGEICPDDAPGVLVVRHTLGPGGMKTLWQNDIDHDQRYWGFDGVTWRYFTHDRAVRRVDGSFCLLGRMDDVINVGGKRLSMVEVEQSIQELPDIMEAAAVGISHALLGQMVSIYVVSPVTDRRQQQRLRKQISRQVVSSCGRHALPRRILFVTQLPRTFSGKLMRRQLAG